MASNSAAAGSIAEHQNADGLPEHDLLELFTEAQQRHCGEAGS